MAAVVVVEVFVEAEDGIVAGEPMAVVLVAAKEAACGDVELEHVQEPGFHDKYDASSPQWPDLVQAPHPRMGAEAAV